jgi:hypothetical protein
MPFIIQPLFRKPFKFFAVDADTGQPLDPNVRKKTRVSYYELQNGSNGSKRLVAHKTPSLVANQAQTKAEESKPADEPKKDGSANGDDAPWTSEQDKVLKAMKEDTKSWAQIAEAVGTAKHRCQARWKEINPATYGKKEDAGKKDGGGGGGEQGQQDGENKGGNNQGQGKKSKKGGNNQNNNHNQQNNNTKNDKNQNNNQNQKGDKTAPKHSTNGNTSNNEARFTMNDWLTLQEDDIFSFGELQCLSELIAKDMNQSWDRVAAKFFDLTGRRVHPDDVREKFESMAVVVEGKK